MPFASGHNEVVLKKIESKPLTYPAPQISEKAEYFVSHDQPPEPIGGFASIQKNLNYRR